MVYTPDVEVKSKGCTHRLSGAAKAVWRLNVHCFLYIFYRYSFNPCCNGGLWLEPVKGALCTPLIGGLNTNDPTLSPFSYWLCYFILWPIPPQVSSQGCRKWSVQAARTIISRAYLFSFLLSSSQKVEAGDTSSSRIVYNGLYYVSTHKGLG